MQFPCRVLICLVLPLTVVVPSVSSQGCSPEQNRKLQVKCKTVPSDDYVCNGQGDCECGVCRCHTKTYNTLQRYSGPFCECDDYSCPFVNGKMCADHGSCDCGFCRCFEGRKGKACECSTTNTACMAANGKICNGSGNCVCGACKCNSWSQFYGPTCEDCPTCDGLCPVLRDCVLCKAFHSGPLDVEACESSCPPVRVVETLEIDEEEALKMKMKSCNFTDEEDGCTVRFSYVYTDDGRPDVSVEDTKVCPAAKVSSGSIRPYQYPLSILLFIICGLCVAKLKLI